MEAAEATRRSSFRLRGERAVVRESDVIVTTRPTERLGSDGTADQVRGCAGMEQAARMLALLVAPCFILALFKAAVPFNLVTTLTQP